jgi:hypothetical protein
MGLTPGKDDHREGCSVPILPLEPSWFHFVSMECGVSCGTAFTSGSSGELFDDLLSRVAVPQPVRRLVADIQSSLSAHNSLHRTDDSSSRQEADQGALLWIKQQ